MTKKLILILLCFSSQVFSQNKDSLLKLFFSKTLSDSDRFEAMHKYGNSILFENPDSSIKCGEIELEIAKRSHLKNCEAKAYRLIARAYGNKFDSKSALENYMKGLKISEETRDFKGLSASYNGLAGIYSSMDENKAMDYRLKSIDYAEKSGDKNLMAMCYMNTGGYLMKKNNQKSLEYKLKALKIYEELNDSKSVALCYNQIGNTYLNTGDNKNALAYYQKAFTMAKTMNDKWQITGGYSSLGMVYNNLGLYEAGLAYTDSALNLNEQEGNGIWIKLTCLKQKEEALVGLKRFDKAYFMKVESEAIEDSLFSEDKKKETRELAQKFENEKKLLEEEKLKVKQEEDKKRQQVIIIATSVILLLVTAFAGLMYKRFKVTQKQKVMIEQKEKETQEQKRLIEEKQKEILDSIRYAKRIQIAIITNEKYISASLLKLIRGSGS